MPVPALRRAATASYAANVALGVATATRLLDTRRFRWIHHALYIATTTLTVGAVAGAFGAGDTAGRRLAPALGSLAVIPFAGSRGARHIVVAASAAPWYLLAALGRS